MAAAERFAGTPQERLQRRLKGLRGFKWVCDVVLPPLSLLLTAAIYLFSGLASIIKGDPSTYNGLLTATFTLAGLAIAATAFSQDSKLRTVLIAPSVLFLLSGFLMYFNVVIAQFNELGISASKGILNELYSFLLLSGGIGIFFFFLGMTSLITGLIGELVRTAEADLEALLHPPQGGQA